MYKRGEIVLIPFPFSDLSGQKIRPALVVSAATRGDDVVVVFITTKTKSARNMCVRITPTPCNGIKIPSMIICDKLATLDKKTVLGSIGTLENETQDMVDAAIRTALGL